MRQNVREFGFVVRRIPADADPVAAVSANILADDGFKVSGEGDFRFRCPGVLFGVFGGGFFWNNHDIVTHYLLGHPGMREKKQKSDAQLSAMLSKTAVYALKSLKYRTFLSSNIPGIRC